MDVLPLLEPLLVVKAVHGGTAMPALMCDCLYEQRLQLCDVKFTHVKGVDR